MTPHETLLPIGPVGRRGPHRCAAVLAALLAASAGASTAAERLPVADDDAAMVAMERLGLQLYRADRAAWLTTDQLHAQGLVRVEDVPGKPDGWVTSPTVDPDVWRVAYVTVVDGAPMSFADGTVDFSAEPMASLRVNEPLRPLEADESAQRGIRADALARDWQSCSTSPYNIATVPAAEGGWHVYLMPPQTSPDRFPMGGFHRMTYDRDGRFVAQYAHTRSCLEQSEDALPAGTTLESLVVTHLTSPTPNELHVFMNLAYGKPVFVATVDRAFWTIVGGDIVYLSDLPESPSR